MIHNQWLKIAHRDSQPLAQHNSQCFTTTGSAKLTMIHNQWLNIAHRDSQPKAQHNSQYFTTTGAG
jgi:hypothetical protein